MKYTIKQYAEAFGEVLKKSSDSERKKKLARFLVLLRKNKDTGRLGLILKEVERKMLKEAGLKKVEIESASEVSGKIKKEIEEILGKKIVFKEKVRPELLAGVKILIDDELLVDATGKRQLERIFIKQ